MFCCNLYVVRKLFETIVKSSEKSKKIVINAKLGLEKGRRRHQRPLPASECLEGSTNYEWSIEDSLCRFSGSGTINNDQENFR